MIGSQISTVVPAERERAIAIVVWPSAAAPSPAGSTPILRPTSPTFRPSSGPLPAPRSSDREAQPAFLEATTPRSRDLYARHGFEVAGEIQAGKSPPMWPMLRSPR